MELKDQYRELVLKMVVEDMPQNLWQRLIDYSRKTYGEAFSIVSSDPSLLKDQRSQKLFQERYFKMEHAIAAAAKESGIPTSASLIGSNLCYYSYVGRGRVGFTQSYVQDFGEMPTPAGFRTQLQKMSIFRRESLLDLGDVSSELIAPKQVIGILLHSPAGKTFEESKQQLGDIGFYVPYEDGKAWAVELALSEILSNYKPVETREDRASLPRKGEKKPATREIP